MDGTQQAQTPIKEMTITRVFDATREAVFEAWTDPELIAQWWGPEGFTAKAAVDLRQGGAYNITMHGPAGTPFDKDLPMTAVFNEVVPNEKIVFTSEAYLETGAPSFATMTDAVTFEDEADGKTKVTLHVVVTRATADATMPLEGMQQGWTQSLDKLERFLNE